MNKDRLRELRKMVMREPRILCTGNPDKEYTIAAGVRSVFPSADFISLSSGYDLINDLESFRRKIKDYNIFINASRLGNGAQLQLLNAAAEEWKYGHVINIGSSSENHLETYPDRQYAEHKLALRKRSLELNTYRFRTTHIVLGGLRDNTVERSGWLDSQQVAEAIRWILNSDFTVPIIGVEPEKDPW